MQICLYFVFKKYLSLTSSFTLQYCFTLARLGLGRGVADIKEKTSGWWGYYKLCAKSENDDGYRRLQNFKITIVRRKRKMGIKPKQCDVGLSDIWFFLICLWNLKDKLVPMYNYYYECPKISYKCCENASQSVHIIYYCFLLIYLSFQNTGELIKQIYLFKCI